MNDFIALIVGPLTEVYSRFSMLFPNLLAMLVIILFGIIAARILRAVLFRLLKAVKFDSWSDRMGFTSMLRKGDFWSKPSAVAGAFLFWILIFVSVLTGLSALHVRVVDAMISEITAYLPRAVSAILILVFGYIATGLIAQGLVMSLVNSGFTFTRQIARAVRLLLIVLIVAMALEQLQVAPGIVVAAFTTLFGGIVLALAIAFGIAGVDTAKRIIEAEKKEDPAREIQHV